MDRNVETLICWLIDALENKREQFPKTLVYCNSITDVSKLYNYVVKEIPTCSEYVQMFHSETPDDTKQDIISSLKENESQKRVIFSTSALGMGIDVVNCHSVILYGPPRTAVDLIQLIGRVGRDEQKSVAVMMFSSQNLRYSDQDVKQLFTTKTCRRVELMRNFLTESEINDMRINESNSHTCCDICAELCNCGKCENLVIEKIIENIDDDSSDSDTIDYVYDDIENLTDDDFDVEESLEDMNEDIDE